MKQQYHQAEVQERCLHTFERFLVSCAFLSHIPEENANCLAAILCGCDPFEDVDTAAVEARVRRNTPATLQVQCQCSYCCKWRHDTYTMKPHVKYAYCTNKYIQTKPHCTTHSITPHHTTPRTVLAPPSAKLELSRWTVGNPMYPTNVLPW